MKKVVFLFALLAIFVSCAKNEKNNSVSEKQKTAIAQSQKPNRIDVVCFYGKNRCITCRHIEQYSKELLQITYKTQLQKGDINFRTVDFSTKEGEAVADKYQITFTSLLILKYTNGKESVTDMTDFAFSTAKDQQQAFKAGMKQKIDSLLEK
jgi:hypothetical protein